MQWCHWWYHWHHMTKKVYDASPFDHLELTNRMVSLITLLAPCETDTSIDGITQLKKLCCNDKQYKMSTDCSTYGILWQFFLIVLAFIDNFYVYDVIEWPHTGRKCGAKLCSFLLVSVCFPIESHDFLLFCLSLIGPNWSHDLNNLPLQCLTQLSSSGGIKLVFDISVSLLFYRISVSYFS